MTKDEIIAQLHHPRTSLPPICPSDHPNGSNTKSLWTPEELHCITGCRCFRNYRHIIDASKDGHLIDTGEFPISLGSYTTIPKAPHCKLIDQMRSYYLDIVHVDIAFGDCASVGGYKYASVFVNHATRYNWTFGLKSLEHDDIIAAFLAFRDEAGSLACQFRCDCDEKLFGSSIWSILHSNKSLIVSSPAGRQSGNGLIEAHWKIMVHMSRAYLTEKQMPRSFWSYAIRHAARMMNVIPGKYKGKLASPFMLVHGVCPDQRAWLPIFLLSVISITRMIATPHTPRTRPTHLTELSLDVILHPLRSSFTTLATKNTTNQTATVLIPIAFHFWFTRTSNMTVAYSFLFIGMKSPRLVNLSFREQGWPRLTPHLATPYRALSWIYLLILTRPRTTLFNMMMVLLPQSRQQKCQTLSPSQQLIYRTIPISFRHSLKLILKSHLKKTGNITKAIYPNYLMVPIGSAINPTSTRNRKTGELLSLILPQRGRISAQKASFSPATTGLCSIVQHPPIMSAPTISYANAPVPFCLLLILNIRIETCGLRVFEKRKMASNPSTPTTKYCLRSTVLFVKKEPLVPFQQCASSPLRRTK